MEKIPFYRDTRYISILLQVIFLVLVVGALVWLGLNMLRSLERQNLSFSFSFLTGSAGFQISEGPTFDPAESYLKAFWVGIVNTLRVGLTGIVLATVLGFMIGISRLSSNWLVNRLAFFYVEFFRNTPLLVQIFFFYIAVVLQLPAAKQGYNIDGWFYLSNAGMTIPGLIPTPNSWTYVLLLLASVVGSVLFARAIKKNLIGFLVPLVVAILGWFILKPFGIDHPELGNFRVTGGSTLSAEFTALLVALVLYTSAFTGEIVRGAIQAIDKGQWEASRSLGLNYGQTLQLIIIPQALRILVPPMGNQYLNLIKNSSLAVAIAYPDVFNVASTAGNQSGNNLQAMTIILLVYLTISLTISFLINLYNRSFNIRGAR